MIDPVDYAHLKRVVTITMILSRYGLLEQLRKSGRQLVGRCPIHGGANKRQFVVNPHENTWHCFGDCSRGGAILELVAGLENVEIHEAAVRIASWFAVQSPHIEREQRRRKQMSANDRPAYKAFVVEEKDGDEDKGFWNRVGSAWPHKDGKGFNLVIPPGIAVSGRIVLREFTDEDAKAETTAKSNTRRK